MENLEQNKKSWKT